MNMKYEHNYIKYLPRQILESSLQILALVYY